MNYKRTFFFKTIKFYINLVDSRYNNNLKYINKKGLNGDWGLGIGDWGFGVVGH
jgi:hypothetical protein